MRRAELERLLPGVVQRTVHPGDVLGAVLDAMEALHAPVEDVLDHVEQVADPWLAPDQLVPYLATWVDLGWLLTDDPHAPAGAVRTLPSGHGALRSLVAAGAWLAAWRGTEKGLVRLLELATGLTGFQVDERPADADGRRLPFHLVVVAPPGAEAYQDLVRLIVSTEKPAWLTSEVRFSF
ncbi:MAG TPA: phage tail protein [Acidimicrobiales bacterium]|jgi:phage tail-like protein